MTSPDPRPDLARPPWAGATQTADEAVDALVAIARQHTTHAETADALPSRPGWRTMARWWSWLREHRPGLDLPPRDSGSMESAARARAGRRARASVAG